MGESKLCAIFEYECRCGTKASETARKINNRRRQTTFGFEIENKV